jgi:hypothetical protein
MAAWQYGSLIVSPESWEEGEKRLLKDTRVQVDGWLVRWCGPNKQEGSWKVESAQKIPVRVLNNLGSENWEIVTVFRVGDNYEYIMRRPAARQA